MEKSRLQMCKAHFHSKRKEKEKQSHFGVSKVKLEKIGKKTYVWRIKQEAWRTGEARCTGPQHCIGEAWRIGLGGCAHSQRARKVPKRPPITKST